MNELFFSISGFIGAGIAVAVGTTIIKLLLSRLNWPKNETIRLVIACFILPVFMLFIHANGPVGAIKWFIAAFIVLIAYILEGSKKKASAQHLCTNCGVALMAMDAFCSNCGKRTTPKERSLKGKMSRDAVVFLILALLGTSAVLVGWYYFSLGSGSNQESQGSVPFISTYDQPAELQQAITPSAPTTAPTTVSPENTVVQHVNKSLRITYNSKFETLMTIISFPSGESTCNWSYTGGNHAVPYQETTKTKGFHSISINLDGLSSDVSALCHDDSGTTYSGAYTLEQARADIQSQTPQ